MNEYRRLTKLVDVDGARCIACAGYNTDKCCGNCAACGMMHAILMQLCTFEEAFDRVLSELEETKKQ